MSDGIAQAVAAAEAANAAFPAWSALGPNARRTLLNCAAEALEARTDEFVEEGGAKADEKPKRGRGAARKETKVETKPSRRKASEEK